MSKPPSEFDGARLRDFPDLNLPEADRGYLIMGPVGTGKTHLAAAIFHATEGERIFATARNCLRAFRSDFDGRSIPELPAEEDREVSRNYNPAVYIPPTIVKGRTIAERASQAALAVIDDYGANYPSDWAREQLLGILDDRMNEGRFTIVTTNLDMGSLKGTDERFFDRLRYLSVVALTGKSLRRPISDDLGVEEAGG